MIAQFNKLALTQTFKTLRRLLLNIKSIQLKNYFRFLNGPKIDDDAKVFCRREKEKETRNLHSSIRVVVRRGRRMCRYYRNANALGNYGILLLLLLLLVETYTAGTTNQCTHHNQTVLFYCLKEFVIIFLPVSFINSKVVA